MEKGEKVGGKQLSFFIGPFYLSVLIVQLHEHNTEKYQKSCAGCIDPISGHKRMGVSEFFFF